MSYLKEIRARVEESKELNGVFGPQAQDDCEYLLSLVDQAAEALRECRQYDEFGDEIEDKERDALLEELEQ